MPDLPIILPASGGTVNIPDVPSVRPRLSQGFGALGAGLQGLARGLSDASQTVSQIREEDRRAEEAVARRDANDFYSRYLTDMNGRLRGSVSADGTPVAGWDALDYDSLDSKEGGASQRLAAAQKKWLSSPEYASLSPRAKTLVDAQAESALSQFKTEAARIDLRNAKKKNAISAQNVLAASLSSADSAPLDDDATWKLYANKASADTAVVKMGTEVLNPEDLYRNGPAPDASRLVFRSGDGERAVFETFLRDAQTSMTAARAARMVDAAKAETDLDRQESFLALAEAFAENAGADEKTRAAVAASASALRADALQAEKLAALDALATGAEYKPDGNPRREAAIKWAQPKIDLANKRATDRFVSSMIRAGIAVDPQTGRAVALAPEQQADANLAALADGQISPASYTATAKTLEQGRDQLRKDKARKIAQDVCAALGTEIETVWNGTAAELKEKEDPAKKIGSYTYDETVKRMVPDRTAELIPGGMDPVTGMPAMRFSGTGKLIERTSTVRRKRDLLAADVAKAVDLLMGADAADGLLVDLDGNPSTPSVKMDARAYTAKLLDDIKKRQLAVDLDTQLDGVYDALAIRDADRRATAGEAMRRSPFWRLRQPQQQTAHSDNADEE